MSLTIYEYALSNVDTNEMRENWQKILRRQHWGKSERIFLIIYDLSFQIDNDDVDVW